MRGYYVSMSFSWIGIWAAIFRLWAVKAVSVLAAASKLQFAAALHHLTRIGKVSRTSCQLIGE